MTTTVSVIRTAVDPVASAGVVTLDFRSTPTEIFFTSSADRSVVLIDPPTGTGTDPRDYDGARFKIIKVAGTGSVTIFSGSTTSPALKSLIEPQWAEFIYTGVKDMPSETKWRIASYGSL